MEKHVKPFTILLADDDPEDCLLVREALRESGLRHDLRVVGDGEQLLEYLHCRGRYESTPQVPKPDLVLLDLNMPRKDGREALRQLKSEPALRQIPVVVLTTSTHDDDVRFAYSTGVNSYITKPVTFRETVEMMRMLSKYWFELVELPSIA